MENDSIKNNVETKNRADKKVMILSVVAVVVLVLIILGTTYAMFTADLTGQQENYLNTGYVKMDCAETTFNIENVTALTDEQGIAAANNMATCTLTTDMSGKMTIGYDVALYDVDVDTPTDALGVSNVKAQIYKKVNGGDAIYLAGSTATAGVGFNTLTSKSGIYDTSISEYAIDSATVSSTETVIYTIKSWVSSEYGGSENVSSNVDATCTDTQYTTEETCEAAGEIWGPLQIETQVGASFSFKLKVGATQVFNINQSQSNVVYSWSTTYVNSGDSKDSISGYTTDYTTLGKNNFLKHNIGSNNTVESQEVCYILNDNMYCLKGGDDDASYEANKTTLLESFGESNCSVAYAGTICSASGFEVNADDLGNARVYAGTSACEIDGGNSASCY